VSRPVTASVLALIAVLLLAGCRYDGVTSLPLPFRVGVGDGSYPVVVHLAQAANLVQNAEVKVGDVTVGTVTGIHYDAGHARLDLSLAPSAVLPGNATARVAQKTLLGAEYLELAPPSAGPAVGRLRAGDVIPLERTGRYPETEEVFAALAALLNGGGLAQIQTITTELDRALVGREPEVRALTGNLARLLGTLDAQRGDIVRAMAGLDRLAGTVAGQRATLDRALDTLPAGLAAIERDRGELTASLSAVAGAGDAVAQLVARSRGDTVTMLRDVQPILGRLADAGQNLTRSVSILGTFPVPSHTGFPAAFKGDYANGYLVLDLDPATLSRNLLDGFRLPGPSLLNTAPLGAGLPPSTLLPPALTAALPGGR
jgi:phospholipid/cholesterol/gamma-HCH transport system substrate-binding protein